MKIKRIKKLGVIVLSIVIISVIAYFVYIDNVGNSKYLNLELVGSKNVTIEYGNNYNDLGAVASYNDKNITNDIKTDSNLNLNVLGSYSYIYSIFYKKQSKEIVRNIKVVDTKPPILNVNGKEEIVTYIGNDYNDEGASALDNYDGDLTSKIEVDNKVDSSKVGDYEVKYRVVDSSGNESVKLRKVKVLEKEAVTYNEKVAVLNYHFFYKNEGECNESICLNIDKFKEQLEYLKDNNFKILTMKEYIDWLDGKLDLYQKSVLITVDDGAFGTGFHNGNYLIPVLEEYKVPATLFLITGWWDISNYKSDYLTVLSHTNNLHIEENCGYRSKVNCVSYEELIDDLKKSIEIVKSTDAFCFPFYETTEKSLNAIKELGFKIAFVGGNRKSTKTDNKYKLPRYVVYRNTDLNDFKKMVN